MTTETILTRDPAETEAAGFAFAKTLVPGDFVALFGEIGAGKTAFVRGAVSYLSPGTRVQSPTYTIVNEYPGKIPVFHFDMYRISDGNSLYGIGFDDYLERRGICFAEWSENIGPWLPEDYISVYIEKDAAHPDMRTIRIRRNAAGSRKESL